MEADGVAKTEGMTPLAFLSTLAKEAPQESHGTRDRQVEQCKAAVMRRVQRCVGKLSKVDAAWIFNEPVDEVRHAAPNYLTIITNPQDLRTVQSRLVAGGHYADPAGVKADILTMLENCRRYNGPTHSLMQNVDLVSVAFDRLWTSFDLDAQWEDALQGIAPPPEAPRRHASHPPRASQPGRKRSESARYRDASDVLSSDRAVRPRQAPSAKGPTVRGYRELLLTATSKRLYITTHDVAKWFPGAPQQPDTPFVCWVQVELDGVSHGEPFEAVLNKEDDRGTRGIKLPDDVHASIVGCFRTGWRQRDDGMLVMELSARSDPLRAATAAAAAGEAGHEQDSCGGEPHAPFAASPHGQGAAGRHPAAAADGEWDEQEGRWDDVAQGWDDGHKWDEPSAKWAADDGDELALVPSSARLPAGEGAVVVHGGDDWRDRQGWRDGEPSPHHAPSSSPIPVDAPSSRPTSTGHVTDDGALHPHMDPVPEELAPSSHALPFPAAAAAGGNSGGKSARQAARAEAAAAAAAGGSLGTAHNGVAAGGGAGGVGGGVKRSDSSLLPPQAKRRGRPPSVLGELSGVDHVPPRPPAPPFTQPLPQPARQIIQKPPPPSLVLRQPSPGTSSQPSGAASGTPPGVPPSSHPPSSGWAQPGDETARPLSEPVVGGSPAVIPPGFPRIKLTVRNHGGGSGGGALGGGGSDAPSNGAGGGVPPAGGVASDRSGSAAATVAEAVKEEAPQDATTAAAAAGPSAPCNGVVSQNAATSLSLTAPTTGGGGAGSAADQAAERAAGGGGATDASSSPSAFLVTGAPHVGDAADPQPAGSPATAVPPADTPSEKRISPPSTVAAPTAPTSTVPPAAPQLDISCMQRQSALRRMQNKLALHYEAQQQQAAATLAADGTTGGSSASADALQALKLGLPLLQEAIHNFAAVIGGRERLPPAALVKVDELLSEQQQDLKDLMEGALAGRGVTNGNDSLLYNSAVSLKAESHALRREVEKSVQ